jgi:hypothetical protein
MDNDLVGFGKVKSHYRRVPLRLTFSSCLSYLRRHSLLGTHASLERSTSVAIHCRLPSPFLFSCFLPACLRPCFCMLVPSLASFPVHSTVSPRLEFRPPSSERHQNSPLAPVPPRNADELAGWARVGFMPHTEYANACLRSGARDLYFDAI